MKRKRVKRTTPGERAYIRDLERVSGLELLAQGRARLLCPDEYPEPVKRFLARERSMLHVRLPARTKRRLEALSRQSGVSLDELARRWIEQGMERDAG